MISHSRGIGGTGPLMRDTAGQGTARLAARPAAVHLRGARGVLTSLQKSTPCCREWRLTPSRQLSGRAGETHPSPRQLPQREKHPPSAQKAVWAPPLPSKALWAPPLPSKASHPRGLPDSGSPAVTPRQRHSHLQARACSRGMRLLVPRASVLLQRAASGLHAPLLFRNDFHVM